MRLDQLCLIMLLSLCVVVRTKITVLVYARLQVKVIINLNTLSISGLFPHIIAHPTDTSAAAPFSGVFTCSVTGCGHLNITWYRRGGSLPTKSESTEVSSPTVTTSTLVIPNVTSDDVGRYYCLVWANSTASRSNDVILNFSGMYIIKNTLPYGSVYCNLYQDSQIFKIHFKKIGFIL